MRVTGRSLAVGAAIVVMGIMSLSSISCAKPSPSEEIVVRVNDFSLSRNELNELYAEYESAVTTPQARELFIDNLVIRKLLLQEGQRRGLDRAGEFLEAVEKFWEQSLLKIVVDQEVQAISKSITVTDREVRDEYTRRRQANPRDTASLEDRYETIKARLMQNQQKAVFDQWTQQLRENAQITINRSAANLE